MSERTYTAAEIRAMLAGWRRVMACGVEVADNTTHARYMLKGADALIESVGRALDLTAEDDAVASPERTEVDR